MSDITGMDPQPVPDLHMDMFNALQHPALCLAMVSTVLDGTIPTSAICQIEWVEAAQEYAVTPWFIVVTDDIRDRLTDPSQGLPEAPMEPSIGDITACTACGLDIQYLGDSGNPDEPMWYDRGGNWLCVKLIGFHTPPVPS